MLQLRRVAPEPEIRLIDPVPLLSDVHGLDTLVVHGQQVAPRVQIPHSLAESERVPGAQNPDPTRRHTGRDRRQTAKALRVTGQPASAPPHVRNRGGRHVHPTEKRVVLDMYRLVGSASRLLHDDQRAATPFDEHEQDRSDRQKDADPLEGGPEPRCPAPSRLPLCGGRGGGPLALVVSICSVTHL